MKLAVFSVFLVACTQNSTSHIDEEVSINSEISPAILEVRCPTGSLVIFSLSKEELTTVCIYGGGGVGT